MISSTVRRSAVSLIVAAVLLWALARARLIDVQPIIDAAVHAPGTLSIVGFLLLVPLVVGSVRYYAVLRAMARYVPLTSILAASFISAAVSIWMPASAGFMEVIRFGLLVRSTRRRTAVVSKTDLAVVGLVDRLVGLATVALVGLVGGAYVLVTPGAVPGGGTEDHPHADHAARDRMRASFRGRARTADRAYGREILGGRASQRPVTNGRRPASSWSCAVPPLLWRSWPACVSPLVPS